jgi:hypothetical protein
MPEQLTKYPDVTREVLESAGAKCGGDQPRAILKDCPAESFCKLPGGELCIYGLPQARAMTQISEGELCPRAGAAPTGGCQFGGAVEAAVPLVAALAVTGVALMRRRLRIRRG